MYGLAGATEAASVIESEKSSSFEWWASDHMDRIGRWFARFSFYLKPILELIWIQ